MKAYVITIEDREPSVKAAEKCIESAAKFGIKVEKWPAITPRNTDIVKYFEKESLPDRYFHEEYSNTPLCMAAFSSHRSLWLECIKVRKPFLILEHDAYFVDKLPVSTQGHIVNFGKPSYGDWRIPNFVGESKMFSKDYLPGAHAYKITPSAAEVLVEQATWDAGPTDVYIHKDRFPFLHEFYPWPIEVRETFTTIQRKHGCYAKTQYNDKYQIIR